MPWDYRAFRCAVRASSLPPLPRLLAYTLNEYMPRAFPSLETLCEETGMSRRSVQRALQTLKEAGWIEISRRHNNTSVYTLVSPVLIAGVPVAPEDSPEVSERHRGGCHSGTSNSPSGVTVTPGGVRETPQTLPEVSERHPKQDLKQTGEAERDRARAPSPFCPDDFDPTEAHKVRALELGVNLREALELFRCSELKPYSDVNRRFMFWLTEQRNFQAARRFKRETPANQQTVPPLSAKEALRGFQ